MKLFRVLRSPVRSAGYNGSVPREQLPEINSFVDVAIGGSRERHSICVDAIEGDTLTTRTLRELHVGTSADFIYANSSGRFRFVTICTALGTEQAHFTIPPAIKTIADFGSKRSAVRLDAVMAVDWRYAPGRAGSGDFEKGSMTSLSRGGAALIVARELKVGTYVELRFTLKAAGAPLVLVSEVMRTAKIESSGKNSAGIRFTNIDGASERSINEFIYERQALRRERGVV